MTYCHVNVTAVDRQSDSGQSGNESIWGSGGKIPFTLPREKIRLSRSQTQSVFHGKGKIAVASRD